MPAAKRRLNQIETFSNDLHEAQKHLRILSALRWDPDFERKFLEQSGRPSRESALYRYPKYQATKKDQNFLHRWDRLQCLNETQIRRDTPSAASIFENILQDFKKVHELRGCIGQEKFGDLSRELFGTLSQSRVLEVAQSFSRTLGALGDEEIDAFYPKVLSAKGLAAILRERLREAHLIESVDVRISSDMTADAAAGCNYVKLRDGARFSLKDADVLLYHEIFTHVVTALNGRAQQTAKWLAFDSPRCTSTQEGLAVLSEILAGKTYPRRLRKIVDRIVLLSRVEAGDHAGQLYDWLRDRGYSHRDSLSLIVRALRGIAPGARAPFTKDTAYLRGLIEVFNFIKANLIRSRYDRIHALFIGKLALTEIPALLELEREGIVQKPRWIPETFLDLDALVTWFSCMSAFGSLESPGMQVTFRG